MINIAKKKLPMPVVVILLYLSYCAASWFVMRGNLAYIGYQYGLPGWFVNDIWAFFLGGLLPTLFYAFLASTTYRGLMMRTGGDLASVKYGIDLAVVLSNLVLFGLKFIYIAFPLYSTVIEVMLDPVVTVLFVGLYMWYAFYQNYVDRAKYRFVLVQVMTMFITVYGLFAILSMLLSVAA